MHFRLRSIAILSFFLASCLLVGTRTAGAETATATINSISASGVGGPLGTVTFADSSGGSGDHAQALRIAAWRARVSYSRERRLRPRNESGQTGRRFRRRRPL